MKKLRIERGHPLEKPVYVYDKDLKFIGRYNSLADTARATGAERNVISGYLGTDKVLRNSYVFKDSLLEGSVTEDVNPSLVVPREKHKKGSEKNLFVYDLNGSFVKKYNTYSEGAQELGVYLTNINEYVKTGKAWNKKYLFTDIDKGEK
jgi:hypothetical protein